MGHRESFLFPCWKTYSKTSNTKFSGQIVAVDGSCWIHKGTSIWNTYGKNCESWVVLESFVAIFRICSVNKLIWISFIYVSGSADIFFKYLTLIKNSHVVPYVAFDRPELPNKATENRKRAERKNKQERVPIPLSICLLPSASLPVTVGQRKISIIKSYSGRLVSRFLQL